MKISILLENTAKNESFNAEHGLSMYIETENLNILFDTGASSLFAENAKQLGVDLANVDIAVISHGHSDHGGGLATFFSQNDKAKVYITPAAFDRYYNDMNKEISIDAGLLSTDRFILVEDSVNIGENIKLLTCNEKINPYPMKSYGLKRIKHGQLLEDAFKHEQYLVIQEKGKNIVFSGCSHKGILNISHWLQPDILIGGFHFMKIEDIAELQANADVLNSFNTDYYTCHCTGLKQYEYLEKVMSRLHYLHCGDVLEL